MTLRLGPDPDELVLTLFRDGSWWTTLVSVDDAEVPNEVPYPEGTSIELVFGRDGTTVSSHSAVVIGADATIRLSEAQVAALVEARANQATLWWSQGADRIPWAKGLVYVDG